jgi:hypothetical protein
MDWYARVESFQHKLIYERYKQGQGVGGNRPPENVDDLFSVRFVGPSGQYEAGQLAPEEKAKLPPDAIAIVQQLLIWLPGDTRLYWLLGELYNANGDFARGFSILDDCRREGIHRLDAAVLREHRQILQEAVAKAPPAEVIPEGIGESASESPAGWLPEWRQLALVGGVAGAAVAVLIYFQIREFRRRRGNSSRGA